MRHGNFGRNLSRSKNEKRRLFALLVGQLVTHGSIVTTKAKAKAVQPMIEKLITLGKKGTDASYRLVLSRVIDGVVAKQIVADAKDRFSGRTSGYTRIVKIGQRMGDATETVTLSFVDEVVKTEVVKEEKVQEKKEGPKEKVKKLSTKTK